MYSSTEILLSKKKASTGMRSATHRSEKSGRRRFGSNGAKKMEVELRVGEEGSTRDQEPRRTGRLHHRHRSADRPEDVGARGARGHAEDHRRDKTHRVN